jgi:GMP synthase-like glutamine amidotransferase
VRVLVVRHHDVDSAGFIAEAFRERGAGLDVRLLPDDGPLPGPGGIDHVVVLGAIASVNDGHRWIADELAWMRAADAAGVPILGICFGGQALCAMAGGRVERAPRPEIGWTRVESAAPDLVPPGPWLEFHGDRCLVPDTARVLAVNDVCVQAFTVGIAGRRPRRGRHLGVQFHPEVDGPQLTRWLDNGGAAEVTRAGLDPDEFLAQTIREEPAARARAATLVTTALTLARPLARS